MAYLQARITSGEPSQQQQAVAQQQGILQALLQAFVQRAPTLL